MVKRAFILTLCLVASLAGAQTPVFPAPGKWEPIDPSKAGFDLAKLGVAIAYAEAHESTIPRDFADQVKTFGALLGQMPPFRRGTNGLVIRHGRVVASFGATTRVEPTYSAAKSFLSTIAGVAYDRGLIPDLDEPVGTKVKDGGYNSAHNAKVTWRHHLTQSSEWEGVMWGKGHDFLGVNEFGQGRRSPRDLKEPGTFYEYNDVRINRLALSLLRIFDQPLPVVLKDAVMDPIGATDTWRYHGYENSWVPVASTRAQSVSGGTRWGGGLWISAEDQARFGLLLLNDGKWNGKQLVSKKWIAQAVEPSKTKGDYGFLWWLNTGRKAWPALSERAFAAVGYGSNTIWIDPERDLVVVWRWHQGNGAEFLRLVVDAIRE